MHTLRKDRAYDIRGEIYLRLIYAFFLCIELNCLINVEQGFTQGLCAFSRLTLMCFVNDNRILSAHEFVEVLVSKEELLYGADNNTLLIVDGIDKTARTLLVVDRLNQTGSVVEAVDCILQLAIQNDTVGYYDNRIEDSVVFFIVERGKTVCDPSNRIGFTTTCRMLDEVALSNAI